MPAPAVIVYSAGPWLAAARPAPAPVDLLFLARVSRQPHKHSSCDSCGPGARPRGLRCRDPVSLPALRGQPGPGRPGCPLRAQTRPLHPAQPRGACMFRVSRTRRTREAMLPPPQVWVHFLRPTQGSAAPGGEVSAGPPPRARAGGCAVLRVSAEGDEPALSVPLKGE